MHRKNPSGVGREWARPRRGDYGSTTIRTTPSKASCRQVGDKKAAKKADDVAAVLAMIATIPELVHDNLVRLMRKGDDGATSARCAPLP